MQAIPLGAAEVEDSVAGEERESVEEGFGFGDGYDFRAAAGREALLEAISDEAASGVAVEADVGEVGSES